MEAILGVIVGLGLAAACGFRVFVPLLVVSIAAMSGHLSLAPSFQWMASPLALTMFATATALEIGGYYVPWIDHVLDSAATPAAVIAGAVVSAAFVTGMSPELGWALAMIAGGVVAGTVQLATVSTRWVSSATTAGLGNPVVATVELASSAVLAVVSIVWPIVAGLLLLAVAGLILWLLLRKRPVKHAAAPA